MSRVVLVGLQKQDEKKISTYFTSVGVTCESIPTYDTAIERLPDNPPTLVVAEKPAQLESLSGLRSVLEKSAPATPTIVLISEGKSQTALEMMNLGAYECIARPFDRFQILAASKRAALSCGRTLFGARVKDRTTPWASICLVIAIVTMLAKGGLYVWNAPPPSTLNLASATLSGIQWEGRSLWVGNWYDSTITHYIVRHGMHSKQRTLLSDEIFRMQDSQPILVCDTPESLITVGFDLKFRSHQRAVGLPTLMTSAAPGTNPTGLAWDGTSLWSTDGVNGLVYRHGPDLRVLDSIKCLLTNPNGLAWDGTALWVMGGSPPRLAKLEKNGSSYVWRGPFKIKNLLPPDVPPTGMAIGFGRLWVVTGGVPHMTSQPLSEIVSQLDGWK